MPTPSEYLQTFIKARELIASKRFKFCCTAIVFSQGEGLEAFLQRPYLTWFKENFKPSKVFNEELSYWWPENDTQSRLDALTKAIEHWQSQLP